MFMKAENQIFAEFIVPAAIAVTCGIASEKLFENSVSWIMRCRSYEGGFGGEPNCEAHGGYTLCGVAALSLLGQRNQLDDEALLRWLVMRQMAYEGGFQGRTGKLVDACYSYWQTASFFVAEAEIQREWGLSINNSLFNGEALQKFLLGASQRFKGGGFCDKPERYPDLYHTCYALGGLALAQMRADSPHLCIGGSETLLRPINHLLNVCEEEAKKAFDYFTNNPPCLVDLSDKKN
ncbi:Protein farnesyltransferase subunit beta [Aphelenchoides bicaudatus]|nr:Protein farnesyltransferase subunit beta [Aphelenchoides bicaudatus]